MGQQGSTQGCPVHHDRRCDGIDSEGECSFSFRLVDGGIGAGIDDDVGAQLVQYGWSGVHVCQIHCCAVQRNQFARQRQHAWQFMADLAVFAGDQDGLHVG